MKRRQRRILPLVLLLLNLSIAVLACDTWVSLSDVTDGPWTILAKNSDRPSFDSQPLVLNVHQMWPLGAVLDLGRITIPQVRETNATLGSHPYWCWGYEEGINEYGVAIGNEGVWTGPLVEGLLAMQRGESPVLGLTGMDLVRLGLERGKTAHEALAVITTLLEEFGQFGSGTPTADALSGGYDNSFIIADAHEAWILETAGRQWVARRVDTGSASISNDLSIRDDWDECSDLLRTTAVQQGWLSEGASEELDFRAVYGDASPLGQSKAGLSSPRSETTLRLQQEREGRVSPRWMMTIARDRSSSPAVDQGNTASSCIAVLPTDDEALPIFWWAPARPSVSCYVPFFVHAGSLPAVVSSPGTYKGSVAAPHSVEADSYARDSYWWLFRKLADLATEGIVDRTTAVRSVFDPLELRFAEELEDILAELEARNLDGDEDEAGEVLARFSERCVTAAWDAATALISELESSVGSEEIPQHLMPYLGSFESTFDTSIYSVTVKAGTLAIDVPGQQVYELNAPDDKGIWTFAVTDTIGVSFHVDTDGEVVSMILHQNSLALEFLREGYAPPAEVSADEAEEYLGIYRNEDDARGGELIHQNGRLAICLPDGPTLELRSSESSKIWVARATESVSVEFHEDPAGRITGLVLNRGGQVMELAREGCMDSASVTGLGETKASWDAMLGILFGLALLGTLIYLVSRGR